MTSMILQSWNGTSWAPVSQDIYTYNLSGKLITDQYQVWNSLTTLFVPSSQKTYYYDVSGNEINETDNIYSSGVPVYTNQWAYTYSSTNQQLTTTYSVWDGTSWAPMSLYTNTYDSSGNMINQLYQLYDLPSAGWKNSTLHVYSNFTASHQPKTDVEQNWSSVGSGAWVNYMQYTNTYNSHDQLTSTTGMSWNLVGVFEFASGDPMSNYHYETYSPVVTSVKGVTATGGDAHIYPVPAQSDLHIDLKWNNAQTADITMCDAQGRVVRHWVTPSTNNFSSTVSVNNLSDGTYFIRINGAEGQIVKQIVVAH